MIESTHKEDIMKEKLRQHAGLLFITTYFVIVLCVGGIPIQWIQALGFSLPTTVYITNSLFMICHLITLIIGLYLFWPTLKKDVHWIRVHPIRFVLTVIIAFIVLIVVSTLVTPGTTTNQNALNIMQATMRGWQIILFNIVLIFVGPLNEEFVFRQVLIGTPKNKAIKWIMWVVSSLCFGLLHIPSLNAIQQIWPYLFDGMILGFVYIKTDDNIIASFSVHLLNNLLSLIL